MIEEPSLQFLMLLAYKVIALSFGLICVFLGYKLFVKGIFTQAGDVNAQFKDTKLIVRKAAPGTFFVLFGAAIMIGVVITKLSFSTKKTNPDGRENSVAINDSKKPNKKKVSATPSEETYISDTAITQPSKQYIEETGMTRDGLSW